jgi:hypothetical protein
MWQVVVVMLVGLRGGSKLITGAGNRSRRAAYAAVVTGEVARSGRRD